MSDVHKHCPSAEAERTIIKQIQTDPGTSTTVTVIQAIADAESVPVDELPVLADVIDPEAIDALFDASSAPERSGVQLSFDYCGYDIEITDDSVTIRQ